MSIGPVVRNLSGPHEAAISDLYRSIFFDADAFVTAFKNRVPSAANILEVGCGEGAITKNAAREYPDASIVGTDMTPRLGRHYSGRYACVHFLRTTMQELAQVQPGAFDLIVLAAALSHVASRICKELLNPIKMLMSPTALFVCKEWEPNHTPIYWLRYISDRWITRDRIQYMRAAELSLSIQTTFREDAVVAQTRISPWRNNLAMVAKA